MSKSYELLIDWPRGLRGALRCAILVAAIPSALALAKFFKGLRSGEPLFDDSPMYWAVASAMLGFCAGWATYAPIGRYRFASSLAIVFLFCAIVWTLLPSPRSGEKNVHRSELPSERWKQIGLLTVVPLSITMLLTAGRAIRRTTSA